MAKFIITKTERYQVEADDARVALDNFHVLFNSIPLEALLIHEVTLSQDDFEYLDGTDSIEEVSSKAGSLMCEHPSVVIHNEQGETTCTQCGERNA